jgi:cellulose synthase/poly-beta-1,6-N-acetylglucosamine synthase-like glycosyltransferase
MPLLSVVIPVRNEALNIHNLLDDLAAQDYPKERFDVIFIDDHSGDATYQLIKNFSSSISIRIFQLPDEESGKKAALIKGLTEAKTDLVLTTDGDCRLKKGWISEMAEFYSSRPAKLVFGAVLYPAGLTFREMMQNLEFLSLVTSAAGSAGINRPILCNAANMGFDRKLYLQFASRQQSVPVSGDDIFFLHWMKQHYPDEIHFLKSGSSFVETSPPKSPGDFINQRMRWTSKSRYYRDPCLIITAIVIFIVSFSLLILLAGSTISKLFLQGFITLFLVKCLTDFIFLYTVTAYYKTRYLLKIFLPLEVIYFFYISIIGIAGNLFPFRWKGRRSKPAA